MLRVAPVATTLPRAWLLGLGLFGVGMLGFVACARELDERPPPIGSCDGPECVSPPDMVAGGLGPGGSGGAAGSGGSDGEDDAVTLEGSVQLVTSQDLLSLDGLTRSVDVLTRGFDTPPQIVAPTEADGSFRIEGVSPQSALQVIVAPSDDASASLFIDTLQAVDSTLGGGVDLRVLSRPVFDDLVDGSFVANPTVFDTTQAAAIVQFIDERDLPIAGLSIISDVGRASIAYDSGSIYSDVLEQTGDRGAVVLLNVAAQFYPGRLLPLTVLLSDGEEASAGVQVVRGAVTLHTVKITVGP
jgi:hypothetical protein